MSELLDIRQNDKLTKDIITDIADKILSGEVNPAHAGVVIKRMAKISEEVLKIKPVKDAIFKETEKYIKGGQKDIFGASISIAPTYTAYDFKECGHTVLNELYKIQEQVEEEIKIIEDELKLMIPTKETMQNVEGQFGIKDTSKDVVIKLMPELVFKQNDDIINVKPPQKIQSIGLKYNKV